MKNTCEEEPAEKIGTVAIKKKRNWDDTDARLMLRMIASTLSNIRNMLMLVLYLALDCVTLRNKNGSGAGGYCFSSKATRG